MFNLSLYDGMQEPELEKLDKMDKEETGGYSVVAEKAESFQIGGHGQHVLILHQRLDESHKSSSSFRAQKKNIYLR